MPKTYKDLPRFEDANKGIDSTFWGPKGSVEEGRGMLNLLTPEVILQAKGEIKEGISIGLNWDLSFLGHTSYGRLRTAHKIVGVAGFDACLDDEFHMNPQAGSQWDGFRHWSDTATGKFYGGLDLDNAKDPEEIRMGVGQWAGAGIAGRGVLLDYVAYAEKHGIQYDPFECHNVSADTLQKIAKEEGVTFQPGDILLIRFGYTRAWESFEDGKRAKIANSPTLAIGVERSEATLRFFYENHFAAVVGDNIALESVPWPDMTHSIHNFLLARTGTPIGEMWYLDTLAEACHKRNRYTFFLASAPFNQKAGISSIPNALAFL